MMCLSPAFKESGETSRIQGYWIRGWQGKDLVQAVLNSWVGSMGWKYPRSIQKISMGSMHESDAVKTFFCSAYIVDIENKGSLKNCMKKRTCGTYSVFGSEARKGQMLSFGFSKGKSNKSRTSRP